MTDASEAPLFDRLVAEGEYVEAAKALDGAGGLGAILEYLERTRHVPPALLAEWLAGPYADDKRLWPRVAAVYERSGEPDKALAMWDRILEARPDDEPALVKKAGILAALGRPNEAVAALDNAPPEIAGSPRVAQERARLLTAAGDLHAAAATLHAAGGADLVTEWFRGDYDRDLARRKMEAALAQFEDDEHLLRIAASQYVVWRDWEAALDVYDRILEAHPADAEALLNKAKLLRADGRLDDAAAVLDAAPTEIQRTQEFTRERAEVLATQGRFDDAASALVEAGGPAQLTAFLERYPDWRGELLAAALRLLPDSVDLLLLRASDALRRGDTESSLADYEQVLELEPGNQRAQAGSEQVRRLALSFEGVAAETALDTVFRAFDEQAFLSGEPWQRLNAILATTGGPYGLVGPRGAGKSWLMLKAVNWAIERGGIGLWFPSPSEYDSQAFLSSLSDSFASEIEQRSRRGAIRPYLSRQRVALVTAMIVALAGLFVVATVLGALTFAQRAALTVGIAAVLIGGYVVLVRARRATRPEDRLVMEASAMRERIRFSLTRKEAAQLGAEAGARWAKTRLSRSRQKELQERPATLSSLMNDFRELARRAGETAAPVVIAVDELDKMDDPERVRALLRDVKAVFEVPRVHFLISVSHEALRALRLGAIEERNEFNSSFYTVIEVPPLTPWDCEALLWKRWVVTGLQAAASFDSGSGLTNDEATLRQLAMVTQRVDPLLRETDFDAEFLLERRLEAYERIAGRRFASGYEAEVGLALGVLAAGNPREIVRMAELVAHTERSAEVPAGVHAALRVLATEIAEFRRSVLSADGFGETPMAGDDETAGSDSLTDRVLRLAALDAAADGSRQRAPALSNDEKVGVAYELEELSASALGRTERRPLDADYRKLWKPAWAGPAWEARFQERWRRLLVRLQVGRIIATAGPQQLTRHWRLLEVLHEIVELGSQSSEVGNDLIRRRDLDRPESFETTAERVRGTGTRVW